MSKKNLVSRRRTLGALAVGASGMLSARSADASEEAVRTDRPNRGGETTYEIIGQRIVEIPFIDTHEHLVEERERLTGEANSRIRCDDWSLLMSHYLDSDLIVAGMPGKTHARLFSPQTDPIEKWELLKPYWAAVRNTGYGQAVRITLQQLYGVDDLSGQTVRRVQIAYERTRRAGFYKRILCDQANIESCQVNCLSAPFGETDMPTLLMQDISIVGMFAGPNIKGFAGPTGIRVASLADWHRVIDWWFAKYGQYAVAVKSQNAYSRDIDYERVGADDAEPLFKKKLEKEPLNTEQQKAVEDHLFWYAVDKATEYGLPVKLHTGYYAGQNNMPLGRLVRNPGSAGELCRKSPQTRFVFMHICYPYYEEMLALAKQYTNATIDMCWSWIINPIAAKDFLKKFLVTAPANKIVTFGGDYIPVEPVLGHAVIARRGITQALAELVDEKWLALTEAMDLAERIMCANAREIFDLKNKTTVLSTAPWAG